MSKLIPMHNPTIDPIGNDQTLGTILSVTLFMISALFNALDQVDVILSILAKLVAIGAGLSSILVAIRTYKKHNK